MYSSRTDIQSRLLSAEPVCWEEKAVGSCKLAHCFSFIWERISPAALGTDRWVATESGGRKPFPSVQSASATSLFFNYQYWLSQGVKSKRPTVRHTQVKESIKIPLSPITEETPSTRLQSSPVCSPKHRNNSHSRFQFTIVSWERAEEAVSDEGRNSGQRTLFMRGPHSLPSPRVAFLFSCHRVREPQRAACAELALMLQMATVNTQSLTAQKHLIRKQTATLSCYTRLCYTKLVYCSVAQCSRLQ